MRRLFWIGVGAAIGSAATRKVTEMREQFTWQVLLKTVVSSLPSVLNTGRSLVLNAYRTLQTKKP